MIFNNLKKRNFHLNCIKLYKILGECFIFFKCILLHYYLLIGINSIYDYIIFVSFIINTT